MQEIMIGLEVHVQLNTETKLFCPCSTKQAEPNENVCGVCLGFPGTKPVLNEKAIELALKIAYALELEINKEFMFSRKTYFYPDLAKNFQITQYEIPIAQNGKLRVGDRDIRIRRVHIEEDPARIVRKDDCALMDYNRSGTPLVEIVTEPDLKSPREARLFVQKLQQILQFIYVSDLEKEGNMRIDANISTIRYEDKYDYKGGLKTEKKYGQRVEIKNVSGAKEVEKALGYEALRQKNIQNVKMETRLWNEKTKTTSSAREKEGEADYGYIFEPDLPKFELSDELLNKIKSKLPELPGKKKHRFLKYGLSEELIDTLLTEPELTHYFEYMCETHNEKASAVLLAKYLKKTLNYHNLKLKDVPVDVRQLRRILDLLQQYLISDEIAELIVREMVKDYIDGKRVRTPEKILIDLDYEKPLEDEQLAKIVRIVVSEHKRAVKDYLDGELKSMDYLIGHVMKKTRRGADVKKIRELLKRELD